MELIILERDDDLTHVTFTGRLDATGVEEVGKRFSEILTAHKRPAVIDLAGIDFLASLGIALLFANAKRLKIAGHRLVLLNPQRMVEEVLLTSKVDKVMPIAFDLEEAIQVAQGLLAGPRSKAARAEAARHQRHTSVSTAAEIKDVLKLSIKNELSELEALNGTLAQFLEKHAVPTRATYAVNLAIEELVVNVIRYAYVDDDPHVINFELALASDQLILRIVDDGRPFDPREGPELNFHSEDREAGGLGLVLVLDMVDTLKYRRVDETNQVEVRISLSADDKR